MIRDPIVEEIRRVRHVTEKACGNDWKRLAEHYRKAQPLGGRVIRGKPKRLVRAKAVGK